jgi:hypothetical protein
MISKKGKKVLSVPCQNDVIKIENQPSSTFVVLLLLEPSPMIYIT